MTIPNPREVPAFDNLIALMGPGFDPVEVRAERFFRALSSGVRRRIVSLLVSGERTVGDIVDSFDLAQPTISRHLAILKDASLLVAERRGQTVVYRLDTRALARSTNEFFNRLSGGSSGSQPSSGNGG